MPRTHIEWIEFFAPEAKVYLERRQELGDYIANPDRAAYAYANFAATDAVLKGEKYQTLDFDRARNIAELEAGLPQIIEPRHQVHTEQTIADYLAAEDRRAA